MSKQIKLMPDYYCSPLWLLGSDFDNIDPATLSLSPVTINRLQSWAARYDATLNEDYPPDSGFATAQEEAEFEEEGSCLWLKLRQELYPEYDVFYYSYRSTRLFTHPHQIERFSMFAKRKKHALTKEESHLKQTSKRQRHIPIQRSRAPLNPAPPQSPPILGGPLRGGGT